MGSRETKRPPRAGMGRPKGSPNKVTGQLKEMILQALSEAGGVEYLRTQATKSPAAFLALIGKVLPAEIKQEVTGADAGPLVIKIVGVKPFTELPLKE